MRVEVTILFTLLALAFVSSYIPFDEIDLVEQEIVTNAIKNHWMDLKNYQLKPKKVHFNMSENWMANIHKIKFRPPHPNATKMAMAHTIQERIIAEAEFKLGEIKGGNRKKRQLEPGLLSPSSYAVIYQAVECEEFLPRPNCDRRSLFVRTIDGTCNNLIFQTQGATFDIFSRLLPAFYEDGLNEPRGFTQANPFQPPLPSARAVSLSIHQNDNNPETLANVNEAGLTHLLMQWGQFIDHDMTYLIEGGEGNEMIDMECWESETHPEPEFCIDIPVNRFDPLFSTLQNKFFRDTLPFERSAPSCFVPLISPAPRNREIINQLTSYLDGSMIYGSTEEEERSVRLFRGGLLLELADQPFSVTSRVGSTIQPGTLPISPVDTVPPCINNLNCFLAGDRRVSEHFSLSIMHTIWLREHNRIAKDLARLNPSWSDEAVFQVARRIVGGQIQNIVFQEYLPTILGSNNVQRFLGPYRGYNASADGRSSNEFATAAYRFGHSQIRSGFARLDSHGNSLGELPLLIAFFNSRLFFDARTGGVDPIVRGLVSVNSRKLDEFINSVITNKLFKTLVLVEEEITPPLDLAARNIQRGRDHGLPTYLQTRAFCKTLFGIESQIASSQTLRRLKALYGPTLESADLFPGGLSESRLPGSLLGATFSCIVGLTFRNLRDGDRFYYENPGVFTSAQLASIKSTRISTVLCENSNIGQVQRDAFRGGRPVSCRNLPRINLELFKDDSIGNMINLNSFNAGPFPGQEGTVELNNKYKAYLIQQQADLTAVGDLARLIGSVAQADDNSLPLATLKVEVVSTLSFSNGQFVTARSKQGSVRKTDSKLSVSGSGRLSGVSAACLHILAPQSGSDTRVFVSAPNCFISTIARGLTPDPRRDGSILIPSTADQNQGIFRNDAECSAGEPDVNDAVKLIC